MNINDMITVLGFCLSCFVIGYKLGKDSRKTQK